MTNNTFQIPIIDLEPSRLGTVHDKMNTALQIDRACKNTGFFVVAGTGIPRKIFEEAYNAMGIFFELSLEEKNKCRLPAGFTRAKDDYTPLGYTGLLEENGYAYMGEFGKPSDYVEKYSVSKDIFNDNVKLPFPESEFGTIFKEKIKPYYKACEDISEYLTELFAIALDLPPHYFSQRINRSNDSLRLLRYPPFLKHFENDQGCAPHRDGSLITLLTNTAPGIEVQTRDGEWIRPVIKDIDYVLINIGDLMMRWSNDTYVSTPHKVVLSNHERQSIVFFKLANDDTLIEPFPKFCKDKGAKYEPIIYKEFSLQKMNSLFSR
jgi:isopenicillin N synthase-like dioxygenase